MVEFSSVKRETLLRRGLEQIEELKRQSYHNKEYKAWLESFTASLRAEFGAESGEVRRFVNAPGRAFVVGTETGKEEEYQRQLECYEEVLKGMVGM